MIQTFEDLCTYVYVIVDELYQLVIQPNDHRPGPRSSFSESEVITLTLVAELTGLEDESVFLDYVARNHLALFPLLPDRSRYNRRRRALGEAINVIRRSLLSSLLALLPPDERPLCLLDSLPISVVGFHHARRQHRWYGWATYGYNATKKQTIYGFKLHVLTTADGIIVDFALARLCPFCSRIAMLEGHCSTFKLEVWAAVSAPGENYLHIGSAPGYTDNSLLWARTIRPLKHSCTLPLPNAQ